MALLEPLIRPVSILVHESTYPLIETVAEQEHEGNKGEYIRQLIYIDLLTRGMITPQKLTQLKG